MLIANFLTSKFLRCSIVILLLIPVFATHCLAQSEEQSIVDIDTQKGSSTSQTQVDEVDPQNGDLVVRHVDLTLKGNGGHDIVIHRNYSMRSRWRGIGKNLYGSFRWHALGVGWKMLVAPRWIETKPFDQFTHGKYVSLLSKICSGARLGAEMPEVAAYLEFPDGSKEQVIPTAPYQASTKGNWRIVCHADVITLSAPNGTTYDLGNIATAAKVWDDIMKMVGYTTVLPAIRATDRSGNWIAYQYDLRKIGVPPEVPVSTILPSVITSSDGRRVDFAYSSTTGRLESMRDHLGRTWSYEHDLVSPSRPMPLSRVILPTGRRWEYAYQLKDMTMPEYIDGNFNEKNTHVGTLASIVYPEGGSVSYDVTVFTATPDRSRGDPNLSQIMKGPRVSKRTLSTGESWTYSYTHGATEGSFDTTKIVGPTGETDYKFMGAGYHVSPTHLVYVNNGWQFGRLMEKSDSSGNRETYRWQPRLISNSIARLYGPELVWDQKIWAANLAEKTIYREGVAYTTIYADYDPYGNPGAIHESGPHDGWRVRRFTYHIDLVKWNLHQVKDEHHATGSVGRLFDHAGRLQSISKDGITTSYTYDERGNIASVTHPRGLVHRFSNYLLGVAQSESQPEGIIIGREVDGAGNITAETNAEGHTTRYQFDGLDRITSITRPLGERLAISYGPNSKSALRGTLFEHTVYDDFGRPASITLGGIIRTMRHDAMGRKIFESNPDSTAGTTYEYDMQDRITRIVNADGTSRNIYYGPALKVVTDERGIRTITKYRSYGDPAEQHLLTIETAGAPVQSASGELSYPAPVAGTVIMRNQRDLVTSVTQGSVVRRYTYDSRYFLTAINNPETGITRYGRDEAGNMIWRSVGDSPGTTFSYDGQNRLVSTVYPYLAIPVTQSYTKLNKLRTVTSADAVRNFDYDANGNLISDALRVDGIELATRYGYNGNDQLAHLVYPRSNRTVSYYPDVLGRPTRVSGYVNNVAYWPSGQIRQIAYANGTVTNYEQHVRLWPKSFTTRKGEASYNDTSYTYDGTGNLLAINDRTDAAFNRVLGYDLLQRLTSVAGPWGPTGAISYDVNGNVTSQSLGAHRLSYAYDSGNRLQSVGGARSSTFSYDSYGNITIAGSDTHTYDHVPNLRCVNCQDGSRKILYGYDGLNQRVSVATGGKKSYEIYGIQHQQLVEYTPGQPDKLVEYFYLGGKRVAQTVSGGTSARTPVPTPPTCTLQITPTTVPAGGEAKFTIGGNGLPAGATAHWYGTANGRDDISNLPLGVAPGSLSLINHNVSSDIAFTRYAVLRDASGNAVCTTNTIAFTYQKPSVSCSLTSTLSALGLGSQTTLNISGANLPANAQAYWNGSANGVNDIANIAAGTMPVTMTLTNTGMPARIDYLRYATIKDASGAIVCTSNTIRLSFLKTQ